MIKLKAKELAKTLELQGFMASNRFVQKFCRRNNLCYRKATHKAQEKNQSGSDACRVVLKFLVELDRLLRSETFFEMLNMDETPVYYDTLYERTIDEVGARSVDVLTCNGEKSRLTLAVTVSSLGDVLPGYVIFKGTWKFFDEFNKPFRIKNTV